VKTTFVHYICNTHAVQRNHLHQSASSLVWLSYGYEQCTRQQCTTPRWAS
jgi:hypothetical protein